MNRRDLMLSHVGLYKTQSYDGNNWIISSFMKNATLLNSDPLISPQFIPNVPDSPNFQLCQAKNPLELVEKLLLTAHTCLTIHSATSFLSRGLPHLMSLESQARKDNMGRTRGSGGKTFCHIRFHLFKIHGK